MNKGYFYFSISMILLLLSACTVDPNASNLYKKEKPLEVEFLLPEAISLNQQHLLKVKVTQEGKLVDAATNIQFDIWQKDHDENSEVIQAQHDGNGIYYIEKTFAKAGIYYIKADIKAHDSHVMPTKQVIVGTISDEELKSLLKKDQPHSAHHSHH
ncbi:FixH family protein [Bacillus sp. 03113]|uniref:FixH family protein n=1 Tax=Bacillus sp. 03113 TaxID=2578211 RepID=UPI001144523A|nr:FixH family protein [Bacillus sp. 03113]